MKKKGNGRIAALAMASLTVCTTAACGQVVVNPADKTKTQVQISAYEAGYGTDWLENFADEFEKRYAETSFEEGKVGVQVSVNWNQDSYETVISKIPISNNAIYLNEVNYNSIASSGLALDLTDYIRQPLTEFNDTETIEDKIDTQLQEYYKSYDGRYYAMPSYEIYDDVLQYDIDLFEDPAYGGFYIAEGGGYTTGLEGAKAKSKGPDNVAGTYDDGLPATYDEFFALMDHMVSRNVTPFIWTGLYKYADRLVKGLWVNHEGEEMRLHFTFDGTATDLINVENGVVTKLAATEITNGNGYMLQKQEGMYRALEFARKLVDNPSYYYVESFSKSLSHVGAQERYLYSRFDTSSQPIAFLVDGNYWECEARGIFNSIDKEYSENDEYSFENRRYGIMPMPWYSEEVAAKNDYKQTVLSHVAHMFVKKDLSEGVKAAAIKFVQFISNRDKLAEFLEFQHYAFGLKLELEDSEKADLSAYALTTYETKFRSNIVYPLSTNPFWLRYSGSSFRWGVDYYTLNASKENADWLHPIYNFYASKSLTAERYFNACYATQENVWKKLDTKVSK